MDKFWQWMKEKEYYSDNVDTIHDGIVSCNVLFADNYEHLPKQILIGYMIEYLLETKKEFIGIVNGEMNINKYYRQLEERINEL